MIGHLVLVSLDVTNIGCKLRYERQVPFLSWRPGSGGGHDQCQSFVVRVDDELSSLDHVPEVFDRFLDPEELLVEGGILLLRS